MDVKDIKCPLEWWAKLESMFPTMASFTHQILGNIGFQTEIERVFSLARILTNLKRCFLQSNNFNKLIFVNKNQPSDPKVGCSSRSNLIEFIKANALKRRIRTI